MNVRFVTVKGVKYLRAEDVAELLLELGAAEETDVRTRIESLVSSLSTPNANSEPQGSGKDKV